MDRLTATPSKIAKKARCRNCATSWTVSPTTIPRDVHDHLQESPEHFVFVEFEVTEIWTQQTG